MFCSRGKNDKLSDHGEEELCSVYVRMYDLFLGFFLRICVRVCFLARFLSKKYIYIQK